MTERAARAEQCSRTRHVSSLRTWSTTYHSPQPHPSSGTPFMQHTVCTYIMISTYSVLYKVPRTERDQNIHTYIHTCAYLPKSKRTGPRSDRVTDHGPTPRRTIPRLGLFCSTSCIYHVLRTACKDWGFTYIRR